MIIAPDVLKRNNSKEKKEAPKDVNLRFYKASDIKFYYRGIKSLRTVNRRYTFVKQAKTFIEKARVKYRLYRRFTESTYIEYT
jgi:hypothetical protein